MKKKKSILIAIILCALLTLSIRVYASYVLEESTKSVFTFGNLKLKLIEKTNENGQIVSVDQNKNIDIANINKLSRIISVKNVGKNPFYLRVKVAFVGISNDNNDKFDASDLISFDIDENWIKSDHYYYYKFEVAPNEETSNLLTEIEFDNYTLVKKYLGSTFHLEVSAEAVQSENNRDNVLEATGWPNN